MKKRFIAIVTCLAMLTMMFTGCGGNTADPIEEQETPEKKAQLVVALNPIIVYDDDSNVIAYNDIKNAIKADRESAALTSLTDNTDWVWVYRNEENWKKRATYALDKWKNGAGATADKLSAYSFAGDGTISLMSYSKKSAELAAYNSADVPDVGLLLSVSGSEEEALCYTVEKDGKITIPAGVMTAIESVGGVKTGFLAEDGTKRSAVMKIIVNSREVWSGAFMNSTAAEGEAVTSLSYDALSGIPVSQGDLVFISVTLNAELNKEDDITDPVDKPGDDTPTKPVEVIPDTISFMDRFDSRFTIVRPENMAAEMTAISITLRTQIESVLEAEQLLKTDSWEDDGDWEILIGNTNRAESQAAYNEIINYRTNHASDFIIRMVGKKLVIAATNDFSLQLAVDYFLDNLCKDDKSTIPANYNYVYRKSMDTIMLGDNNIASYTIRTEKYPSFMSLSAAKDLRQQVMAKTGYLLPLAKDTAETANEILIGPTARSGSKIANINDYSVTLSGGRLIIKGGSTHAANAGVQAFMSELDKTTAIADGYTKTGAYVDGEYSLSGGYKLAWNDEFTGDFTNGDKLSTKKWNVMKDTTNGPWYKLSDVQDKINRGIGGPWITEGVDAGYVMEGLQYRPGVEGENFFLRDDCLVEVTRKSALGYEAVRLNTQNRMNYRYGFTEVRMIMGTKDGACSAVWLSGDGLNQAVAPEIDVYENYGLDRYYANLHTWPRNGVDAHVNHVGAGDMKRVWVYPPEGEHFYDTFHYIGYEWTDSYMAFYLDGEITQLVDISSSKFNAFRQTIVLKLANGVGTGTYSLNHNPGDWLGDNVDSFYVEQVIDFVRIYQKNDGKSRMRVK